MKRSRGIDNDRQHNSMYTALVRDTDILYSKTGWALTAAQSKTGSIEVTSNRQQDTTEEWVLTDRQFIREQRKRQ
jgi:hypothetical protein